MSSRISKPGELRYISESGELRYAPCTLGENQGFLIKLDSSLPLGIPATEVGPGPEVAKIHISWPGECEVESGAFWSTESVNTESVRTTELIGQ